jgi:hypothetical protein
MTQTDQICSICERFLYMRWYIYIAPTDAPTALTSSRLEYRIVKTLVKHKFVHKMMRLHAARVSQVPLLQCF